MKIFFRRFFAPLFLAVLIPGGRPAFATTYSLGDQYGSKQIVFESRTPAEYMEGVANGIAGTISIDPDKGTPAEAIITVPVTQMQTGIAERDEHLRGDEWLNADRYPTIRFDLAPRSKLIKKGADTWFVNAQGNFSLKGITKPIVVPTALRRQGDRLIVEGRFTVRLADYGIYGPAAMRLIGVKVSPNVDVRFKIVGQRDAGWDNVKKPTRAASGWGSPLTGAGGTAVPLPTTQPYVAPATPRPTLRSTSHKKKKKSTKKKRTISNVPSQSS